MKVQTGTEEVLSEQKLALRRTSEVMEETVDREAFLGTRVDLCGTLVVRVWMGFRLDDLQ